MKGVQSNDRNNNTSYTKKYQGHSPNSFAYKAVCIDGKFSNQVVEVCIEVRMQFIDLLKEFLKSMIIAKK